MPAPFAVRCSRKPRTSSASALAARLPSHPLLWPADQPNPRQEHRAYSWLARSTTHPDRCHQGCPHKVRRAESARASLPLLRQPHAHHRDLLARTTAEAPPDPASAEDQDRHLMTTSQPLPRKAVRPSARSPAGHGSVRSNAAFTTQQPHRSSTTYRPAHQKNAWHPSCNAIPTPQPTSLPTLAVARPPPNPHT